MANNAPPEVLIVEDEPITRIVATDAVSDAGFCVREAGDAGEALQVLQDHPQVRLLFTDVNLPGELNGVEMAQKVYEADPEMEFIVTSGATSIPDADLPDHGTFLPKPYSPATLLGLVKSKLALR